MKVGKKTTVPKITGLFFGSFNPVHNGHMIIANFMKQYTGMSEVWFVVSPQNPLKNKATLLDERQRLHMVNLAIGDCSWLRATDIEFRLPKPSYTIHTLEYLKEQYPTKNFALIMGSDSLETIHKWKNYQILLDKHQIFIYPRPGMDPEKFPQSDNLHITSAPQVEISSSEIRKAIKEKKDVRFFLPETVYRYIDEMNFYR